MNIYFYVVDTFRVIVVFAFFSGEFGWFLKINLIGVRYVGLYFILRVWKLYRFVFKF